MSSVANLRSIIFMLYYIIIILYYHFSFVLLVVAFVCVCIYIPLYCSILLPLWRNKQE